MNRASHAELAQVLAVFLLAVPAFFAARFVIRLEPQLHGHLIPALRSPFIASAVLCDAIAALGLVVGAIFQRASAIAVAGQSPSRYSPD